MTPAPVRDLRETSHAREFFLKPFYFLCADFFENGFLYGPVAQTGKRAENRENSGGGVGLKTKLPRLLGTVGTD